MSMKSALVEAVGGVTSAIDSTVKQQPMSDVEKPTVQNTSAQMEAMRESMKHMQDQLTAQQEQNKRLSDHRMMVQSLRESGYISNTQSKRILHQIKGVTANE